MKKDYDTVISKKNKIKTFKNRKINLASMYRQEDQILCDPTCPVENLCAVLRSSYYKVKTCARMSALHPRKQNF